MSADTGFEALASASPGRAAATPSAVPGRTFTLVGMAIG